MGCPSAGGKDWARIAPRGLLLLALVAAIVASGCALPPVSTAATTPSGRVYDHVFVLIEENEEHDAIIGNLRAPTFNHLATSYGLATAYFGTVHPSEGNYVAILGGDSYGIRDDNPFPTHTIAQPSFVDQLDGAGLSWKGYFQSLPEAGYLGTCFPTTGPCLYASKHNGFLNFADVQGNAAARGRIVPDTSLRDDLAAGTLPNFAEIVPDQCHDLHGIPGTCTDAPLFRQTDDYLKSTVDAIMAAPAWRKGTNAIVVTFDEGSTTLGCCDADPGGGRLATVVITNHQQHPRRDATPYNHYSLTATLQAAFGLGCRFNGKPVGFTCDTAHGVKPMAPLFDLPS